MGRVGIWLAFPRQPSYLCTCLPSQNTREATSPIPKALDHLMSRLRPQNPANWGPKTRHGRPPIQQNQPTKAERAREQQQQQQPPQESKPDTEVPAATAEVAQATAGQEQGEGAPPEIGGPPEKKQKLEQPSNQ